MKRYLRVNLLGPGPSFMKNNLPGRRLTKAEKHWCSGAIVRRPDGISTQKLTHFIRGRRTTVQFYGRMQASAAEMMRSTLFGAIAQPAVVISAKFW